MSSYIDLKERLATYGPNPADWQRVAAACGLRVPSITWQGSASNAFTTIIEALDTPEKRDAFRELIKRELPALEQLAEQALAELAPIWPVSGARLSPIPRAPSFYAMPPYIGSNAFVGRSAQLELLDDWSAASDVHPILLFEAIGGMGKSTLTWEWITKRSPQIRADWAGRMWYSFYERGALVSDFLRHALAYVSGTPLENFRGMKPSEMGELLFARLRERPWLLVLDGLERVLVAYHRIDSSEVRDETADRPTDDIGQRDPCAAIRVEDDELLRLLAAVGPSKILITSRLMPRVLLNRGNRPIAGVRRVELRGLRPPDAEALFRSFGIDGDSRAIQEFLTRHCDCHPLVTGILAGLVNDFMPNRGNFDAWFASSTGFGKLDFSELDLVQKRNHILKVALEALSANSRKLISILGMLFGEVDYPTLRALSPFRPQRQPNERDKPLDEREEALVSSEFDIANAEDLLEKAIHDLEGRGLLQYDNSSRRYDLHPVVRAVTVGALGQRDKQQVGERLVDYFSQQTHRPFSEAASLEDIQPQLMLIHTLLKMDELQRACNAYIGVICDVLDHNLEAYPEALAIQRPFFSKGWNHIPDAVFEADGLHLALHAARALTETGQREHALALGNAAVELALRADNLWEVERQLISIANAVGWSRIAKIYRVVSRAHAIALVLGSNLKIFLRTLDFLLINTTIGRFDEADALYTTLNSMGRNWPENAYRQGGVELRYAELQFAKNALDDSVLREAEKAAALGRDRSIIESLHDLRAKWHLKRGEWTPAEASLSEVIRMRREVGSPSDTSEVLLALAKFHLSGDQAAALARAEELASSKASGKLELAQLWLALEERKRAESCATEAYAKAWGDGEPYVDRYDLDQARAILNTLGASVPVLPAYDFAEDHSFPWEADLDLAIERESTRATELPEK